MEDLLITAIVGAGLLVLAPIVLVLIAKNLIYISGPNEVLIFSGKNFPLAGPPGA